MSKIKKRKGFVLVELVIVMLVIGILVTIAFYGGKYLTVSARETKVEGDFHSFEMVAKQMLIENPKLYLQFTHRCLAL